MPVDSGGEADSGRHGTLDRAVTAPRIGDLEVYLDLSLDLSLKIT